MPFRVLDLVLLLNAGCASVSCLYLYMGETETKCFIEDIADDIKVVGKYRMTAGHLSAPRSLGMSVEVKDPKRKVILSHQYGSEGSFTFTSHTPGKHYICICSNSSSFALLSETMLVHLDIQVEKKKPKLTLSGLQFRIEMLTEQVNQIQQEKNYQRYREQCFRNISESTRQRIKCSIVYTLLGLVALACWKSREFKSLNVIEAEDSEKFVKPDIFINVKPKELILPKCAFSHAPYVRLQ